MILLHFPLRSLINSFLLYYRQCWEQGTEQNKSWLENLVVLNRIIIEKSSKATNNRRIMKMVLSQRQREEL